MTTIQETARIDDALVEKIVRGILSVAAPAKVVLFGSASTGRMTRDSDIDLLIVEANVKDHRRESVRIGDALRGLGHAFDVVVMSAAWFDASKDVIGGIAYPANKYGRVIYERSGE